MEIYDRWKMWLEELSKLEQYHVPRCYHNNFVNSIVELHIFADAREEAMAAVAYWRVVSEVGVTIVFVMGKTSWLNGFPPLAFPALPLPAPTA